MSGLTKKIASIGMVVLYLLATIGFGMFACNHEGKQEFVFLSAVFENEDCSVCNHHESKNEISCCTPVSDDACCNEKEADENSCCSVDFAFFDSETSVPAQVFDNLQVSSIDLFVGIFENAGFIASYTSLPDSRVELPPNLFGETLPIYHFCQLRL